MNDRKWFADWLWRDKWEDIELPESWLKIERPEPQRPKEKMLAIDGRTDAYRALEVLAANGFPLEITREYRTDEIKIRYAENDLARRCADLKEENRAVTKAFSDAEREIDRLRSANERLENELLRLEKELAEAKELSLF